ncbi:MAG TPA: aminopeptidase [Moraxellaceae bacterium]
MSSLSRLLPALSAFLLAGCQSAAYYAQAAQGQTAMIMKRQSIPRLLAREDTPADLRGRLETVQRIREFAIQELDLPAQKQYATYVELGRDYPVWSVMASPELSLAPRTWCYWFVGCLAYRGFFRESMAQYYARELEREGLDVYLSGIPAYSTLGWFHDPVLSSFIKQPEAELAELIFHELTHQVLFVPGDTTFNESLAVAVADEGLRRYSLRYPQDLARLQRAKERRDDFVALVLEWRGKLQQLFAQKISDAEKRQGKAEVYAGLQAAYAQLKQARWGGYGGYDAWFASLNNAKLNTVNTYYDLVPALQILLRQQDNDLPRFFAACRELARLDKAERHRRLNALQTPTSSPAPSA